MATTAHIGPCLKYMQTASFQKLFGKLKFIVGNPRMVTLEWVETIGAWSTVSYRRRFNQIMHKRYLGKPLPNCNADLKSKITAHVTTEIISSHKPFHTYKPSHPQMIKQFLNLWFLVPMWNPVKPSLSEEFQMFSFIVYIIRRAIKSMVIKIKVC